MSATAAIQLPAVHRSPGRLYPRHIEIVATRSQKRARPRAIYALVAVAGLFVILMAQLLLSIWLSDGAYQISALQHSQRELSRDQQALSESLNVLQSPQNLAERAFSLGMVMNTGSQGFLSLAGGVSREPTAASADTALAGNAVTNTPNALITQYITAIGGGSTGAPAATAPAGSVTSTAGPAAVPATVTALPSPVTH